MPSKKNSISSIQIRMYRAGTGDFFLLRFMAGKKVSYKMMIDCGCIQGAKSDFVPLLTDVVKLTGGTIDLLVVTHEHADHINGFERASASFAQINFKKVWFAWTESKDDPVANDYRKNYTGIKMALASATGELNKLVAQGYYTSLFKGEQYEELKVQSQNHFVSSLTELNALNMPASAAGKTPTMEDKLRDWKVIKTPTKVSFLEPGTVIDDEAGADGVRFLVLGPPKNLTYLSEEGKTGDGYEKREKRSTVDFSFINAVNNNDIGSEASRPFERHYELKDANGSTKGLYEAEENKWRNIDHDWLYSAGSLALRFQKSINNTSLALAIQFASSEKVLLFPGDAEYGNWISWHDKLTWGITVEGKTRNVNAEYLLNKTVFYKVGHHMSQNGTAKEKGLEMMNSSELAAMATLDLKKINTGWLNTMPNDIIGANLITKTKGKVFFVGDSQNILENIKTSRVKVSAADAAAYASNNKAFKGLKYIDYEVKS